MLRTLRIRDLATIADVTLELGPGLNVLSGETGAGKSMLVDGLALLLGDRADRAALRPGASRIVVEGEFTELDSRVRAAVEAAGLDVEETLVIRREVQAEGRSRAWVNGSPTTSTVLKTLAAALVDLHGQHQSIELAHRDVQRDLLDAYAGAIEEVTEVAAAHATASRAVNEVRDLAARRDEALRRADWLRHAVQEIDAAHLVAGELEAIAVEASRLAQAGALGEQARQLAALLDGDGQGIRDRMSRLARGIDHLARLDPPVAAWSAMLDTAWAQLDELSRAVAAYQDTVVEDPDRLSALERRRDVLLDLARKHGGTLEQVAAFHASATAELDLIDTAALDLPQLERQHAAAVSALGRAAERLTARRIDASGRLAAEVTRLLPKLALTGARFGVRLLALDEIAPTGAEQVEFAAALNAGMPERPIAGAASGGELARLMLALKVAVARHDATATLVFDEVDQGIGGETGTQVGAALVAVAARHQVLVITHLPQVAARADRHLQVAKGTRAGVATSDVAVLHGEDRVGELARMLGNPDDPHARRLALAMLA